MKKYNKPLIEIETIEFEDVMSASFGSQPGDVESPWNNLFGN